MNNKLQLINAFSLKIKPLMQMQDEAIFKLNDKIGSEALRDFYIHTWFLWLSLTASEFKIFSNSSEFKKHFSKEIAQSLNKNLKTVQSSLVQYFEILKDQIVISKHVPHATILTTLLHSLSEALQGPKKPSNFASSNN